MIVKDESKYLKMCLEALKPILQNIDSELIIVDTGSTDNTVEIAKRYTDKIFFHQWNNDFAEARNITIEKSQGEWYFYIDADEILENPESIITFFTNDIHYDYKSLAIKIKNLSSKENIGSTYYARRIVKKDPQLKFRSKIHEQLPPREPVYLSEAAVLHYGYINTDEELIYRKFKRNSEILKKELKKDPNNVYLLYHLSKTYNLNGDYLEALAPIQKAYKIIKKANLYPLWILNFMIDICIKNNLFFDAEKVAKEAIKEQKEETTAHIITYLYLAQVQAILRKNSEAIENYKHYLRLTELYEEKKLKVDFDESIKGLVKKDLVYEQIAVLYDRLLDFENAFFYTKKIINFSSDLENIEAQQFFKKALNNIVKLSLKYNKYDEIVTCYLFILNKVPEKLRYQVENNFLASLEISIRNNISYKKEIIKRFSELKINSTYVFLNKLRKKEDVGISLTEKDIEKIREIDFHGKMDIYGEFIYYMIKECINIESIMTKLDESEINKYMEYMAYIFKDFSNVIKNYFMTFEDRKYLNYCIFSKALKRAVLIKEEIDDETYSNLFKRYIEEGIFYIEKVYRDDILDTENIYVVKNNEEAFFIYMRKAYLYKQIDSAQYLQYLRKALNSYDYMKKGIEILLQEVKQEKEEEVLDSTKNNEFEEYKEIVKNNINILVEARKIAEAKLLVDEYLKIVPNDLEMLTLKSEIQLQLM